MEGVDVSRTALVFRSNGLGLGIHLLLCDADASKYSTLTSFVCQYYVHILKDVFTLMEAVELFPSVATVLSMQVGQVLVMWLFP